MFFVGDTSGPVTNSRLAVRLLCVASLMRSFGLSGDRPTAPPGVHDSVVTTLLLTIGLTRQGCDTARPTPHWWRNS